MYDLYLKLDKQSQIDIDVATGLSSNAFKSSLMEITDLFVEWRYVYEHGNVQLDLDYLMDISTAIKNYAEKQ